MSNTPDKTLNLCTSENPWKPGDRVPVAHSSPQFLRECADSCCSFYRCANCGVEFRVEYGD